MPSNYNWPSKPKPKLVFPTIPSMPTCSSNPTFPCTYTTYPLHKNLPTVKPLKLPGLTHYKCCLQHTNGLQPAKPWPWVYAFAKPLSCCQHSILMHSCTTKRGSTTYYCPQPCLTHRILWMAWVQHATTQSRGPRVWHWGRSRFNSVHFMSASTPPLERYSTFHPANFFSISLSCHSKLT